MTQQRLKEKLLSAAEDGNPPLREPIPHVRSRMPFIHLLVGLSRTFPADSPEYPHRHRSVRRSRGRPVGVCGRRRGSCQHRSSQRDSAGGTERPGQLGHRCPGRQHIIHQEAAAPCDQRYVTRRHRHAAGNIPLPGRPAQRLLSARRSPSHQSLPRAHRPDGRQQLQSGRQQSLPFQPGKQQLQRVVAAAPAGDPRAGTCTNAAPAGRPARSAAASKAPAKAAASAGARSVRP